MAAGPAGEAHRSGCGMPDGWRDPWDDPAGTAAAFGAEAEWRARLVEAGVPWEGAR
jgi:hypothetical protein